MPEQRSAGEFALVSRDAAEMAMSQALRLFVGRGRRYSVKQLSNATGIKDRVIECALAGVDNCDHRPLHLGAVLSIASFLGADFTNEWLCLAHQGAFDLPEGDPNPGEFAADTSDDTAAIVRAAKDGRFDEEERRALRPVGARMMSHGAQLVALRPTG